MNKTNGWSSIQNIHDGKCDENSTNELNLRLAIATLVLVEFFAKMQYAVRHFAI